MKIMKKNVLLLFVLMWFSELGFAQNTFLFLDGSSLKTSEYKLNDSLNVYTYLNDRGKMKWLENEFVYSITDAQGNVLVVYKPSEISENMSAIDMLSFIKGEQYVHSNYKPYGAAAGGLAVGLGSALLFPEMGLNVFYSSFVPLTYTGVGMLFKHDIKRMNVPLDCQNSDYYIKGFRTKAVKKRVVYSICGSILGMGIGMAVNGFNMTH
jgi:hypothetical protein